MTVKKYYELFISDLHSGLFHGAFFMEILEPTYFESCKTLRAAFQRIWGFWGLTLRE
jgi:hypothetical protein